MTPFGREAVSGEAAARMRALVALASDEK